MWELCERLVSDDTGFDGERATIRVEPYQLARPRIGFTGRLHGLRAYSNGGQRQDTEGGDGQKHPGISHGRFLLSDLSGQGPIVKRETQLHCQAAHTRNSRRFRSFARGARRCAPGVNACAPHGEALCPVCDKTWRLVGYRWELSRGAYQLRGVTLLVYGLVAQFDPVPVGHSIQGASVDAEDIR